LRKAVEAAAVKRQGQLRPNAGSGSLSSRSREKIILNDQLGPSRAIALKISPDRLQKDLDHFRQKSMELGASMAQIVPADWVQIDERVKLKCSVSLCPNYDKSIHCPPHTASTEFIRKALSRYAHAILFALEISPVDHFSVRSIERHAAADWTRKTFEIVGTLETLAFGSGYYLAMGFGQGSCRYALCGQKKCLVLEGQSCPYPLKARPSMEAVGVDVYGLVTRVGWEIYPIYRSVNPAEVPRALSVGIVFVH
jgi:predicted metal-binding protein